MTRFSLALDSEKAVIPSVIVPSVVTPTCFSPLKEEEEKLSLEGNILLEEDHEAGYEAEGDDDEELSDEEDDEEEEEHEGDEEEAKESAKMKVLRIVAGVASKVKEIIGNLITTAGKVVVTILLGLTGQCRNAANWPLVCRGLDVTDALLTW